MTGLNPLFELPEGSLLARLAKLSNYSLPVKMLESIRDAVKEECVDRIAYQKKDLSEMYAIVCKTEVQKALASTVDNVLEDAIQAIKEV